MTVLFSCLTRRHSQGLASSRDTGRSAARSSPAWAAAYASSAIDGGLVLPDPTMSTLKGPQASNPASKTAPPAASAYGRHRALVSVASCQEKPHWWIEPHTNR